ncbi:MAG TPA: PilZ domain-containing protein [Myxococcota bacterium]|nr:PilZ domain-containing protein [Myxococcota bacterium]
MENCVSILLLDDGELDRVRVLLERLGAEFTLCRRPASDREIPRARDLLITSGRRALSLGRSVSAGDEPPPRWLCVHGQDFGELRDELRGLGVHYLAHSSVDQETLRLLLEMLLHDRGERRAQARLPLGAAVQIRVNTATHSARLVELSAAAARLRVGAPLEAGDWISIELPDDLRSDALDALSGHIARSEREAGAGRESWTAAVELDPLSPEASAELESILCGAHSGTRVSLLSETPAGPPRERRRTERRAYRRRVAAITSRDAKAPYVVLGHDLSADGIRIARQAGLAVGQRIALGLYGNGAGQPLVIEAEIVRDYGARGFGLVFRGLKPEQREQLTQLVETLAPLESLEGETTATRLIVSRVLETRVLDQAEVDTARRRKA